jgi:mannose-1-phosphate guanylyltransferase
MKQTPTNPQLWGIVLAGGEGTRVRALLQRLCGGRGIKQFCAVIGRRSMLEHTLARVERLIPRERIIVVVSADHRPEAAAQLAQWPADNIIYQPTNRDTAPGILLPLAYVSHRDPLATVALFPSDHFILEEERFMASVQQAVAETQRFPHELTLLGMTPDQAEEGYGWIEPAGEERGRATRAVRGFWEKPSLSCAQELLERGALWNTFVCVARAATVWEMTREAAPKLYDSFMAIRRALGHARADQVIECVYRLLCPVNFSTEVCERLPARLRVLPVPDVGWSDWGSVERIGDTLQRLGKMNNTSQRVFTATKAPQQGEARPHPSLGGPALQLRLITASERP